MGILVSEGTSLFHVPYGPSISDGNWDASFVDLKANPNLIPVLPPCVGWPETQELLQLVNAPHSPFMTLAADQSFAKGPAPNKPLILVSFVTLCFAEISHNSKDLLADLTIFLQVQMDSVLQGLSTSLDQPLDLEVLLEIQPTQFHAQHIQRWSLNVMMIASGTEPHAVRGTWGWGIQSFLDGLKAYAPIEE